MNDETIATSAATGRAAVFWFTGLSGAGKTTIAEGVMRRLTEDGLRVLVLDGDDVRARLHRDLGFTEADIKENNALLVELCHTHRADHDAILVPIISPYACSRHAARAPPAQIPACAANGPGSCRRSDAIGLRGLCGPCSSDPWARGFGDMPIPALCPGHA